MAGLKERVAANKKELGLDKPAAPTFDADLVPEVEAPVERTDDDLSRAVDQLGIVGAYRQWCGKMDPKPGKRRESIMVSCPIPGHKDTNPSAWLNSDKGTWFCGACQQGGDAYDIAAFHHGFDVPGYKVGKEFTQLRERMSEDLGIVEPPKEEPTPTEAPLAVSSEPISPGQSVEKEDDTRLTTAADPPTLSIVRDDDPDVAEKLVEGDPTIDWRSIVPEDTFLYDFIEEGCKTPLPEEYFFWLALVGLGLAVGNKVQLHDQPNVKANFFVCLHGQSGIGKTQATRLLTEVVERALPYDHDSMFDTGTFQMGSVASGEALVDIFEKIEYDPTDPAKIIARHGVRGLLEWNEFVNCMNITRRTGNTLEAVLLQLYDSYGTLRITSRTHGTHEAVDHFGSAISTTQPKAIRRALTDMDITSGFVNRWIFAFGPTKIPNLSKITPINADDLVNTLSNLRTFWTGGEEIIFDSDAWDEWTKFFHATFWPLKTAKDANPIYARLDLVMKKIALAFAINEKTKIVTGEMMTRVLSLFEYLHTTYGIIASDLGKGELGDLCERIQASVQRFEKKHKMPPTKREITWSFKGTDPALLMRALDILERIESLKKEKYKAKNGAIVERYAWNA